MVREYFGCIILIVVCLFCKPVMAQDVNAIKSAIIERSDKLNNLIIECSVEEVNIPLTGYVEPTTKESRGHNLLISGASTYKETLYLLGNLCRYEKEDIKSDRSFFASKKSIQIFTPDRYEKFDHLGNDRLAGAIYDVPPTISMSPIARCLAVRMTGRNRRLSMADLAGAEIGDLDNGQIMVKAAASKSLYFVYTYDKAHDYALTSEKAFNMNQPIPVDEIDNSDFKLVSGISIPYHCDMTTGFYSGSKFIRTRTTSLDVDNCKINDPSNTKQLYTMVWPTGTVVVDSRADVNIMILGKPRTLTDDQIAEGLKKKAEEKNQAMEKAKVLIDKDTGALTVIPQTQP